MYNPGRYLPGGSFLHRMHPLTKIVAVVSLSVVVFRAGAPVLAAIACLLGVAAAAAWLRPIYIWQALRPALPLFALIFLAHLFFTGGTPVPPFPPGPPSITYEGLRRGGLLVGRFTLLVLSASLLTMVTSPSELIAGMERLLKPFKLPWISPSDLALMLSLALRFQPTLLEEIDRMKEARMVRGVDFRRGGLRKRTKAAASLAIPLILKTLHKAGELATAMEARGYRGGPRTHLREAVPTPADYMIMGAAVTAVAFSLFC